LTSIDVSSNKLGGLASQEGWTKELGMKHRSPTGEYQQEKPAGVEFKPIGIIALADAILSMRAILSVDLLKNNIPMEQAKALASILKEHPTLKSLCGNSGEETELDMSGKEIGAEGAIMLAPEIAGNGAMTSLNISSSRIGWLSVPDGWETMKAPNGEYQIFKPLGGEWAKDAPPGAKAEGIIAFANAIPDMGALTVLSLQNNTLCAAGGKALAEGLKDNQVITQLNISSNRLGYKTSSSYDGTDMSGVIALADVIPDMGALSSLTFSGVQYWNGRKNTEDAVTITTAMTDADFSGKHLGSPGAIILAAWLSSDKGALARLDISRNKLFHNDGTAAGKALRRMLAANSTLQELDVSCNARYSDSKGGPSFAREISIGISGNSALIKLGISNNRIGAEQEGDLHRICVAGDR
jgi:hypothetical protein